MEHFDEGSQKDEFRKWMRDHPRGYYLNRRGRPSMMLHRVGCRHLGDGKDVNLSKSPKFCSDDVGELEVWSRRQGKYVERCSTCAP